MGSYEIWGVNSSFGITRRAFYTEALVGSLGTIGGSSVMRSESRSNGFLSGLQSVAFGRWD